LALRYRKSGELLTGYSDSDWVGDCDGRHPTSGNLFIFGGALICRTRKKQAWLQKLLADLQMTSQPILMMENKQGAIASTGQESCGSLNNQAYGHSIPLYPRSTREWPDQVLSFCKDVG